jgi:2'-5' RNA ligase
MQAGGYSFWLMPEGRDERLAAQWINTANESLNGVSFAPHITILGGLGAGPLGAGPFIMLGAALAAGIPKVDADLVALHRGDGYFQRLVVNVECSPTLAQAREAAEELIRQPSPEPFKPHLSLFYGDELPAELPEKVKGIESDLPVSLHLNRLVLARTTGPVDQWVMHRSWALRF